MTTDVQTTPWSHHEGPAPAAGRWFRQIAAVAGIIVALIGLGTLVLQLTTLSAVGSAPAASINMKTNTAVGLALAGGVLFLLACCRQRRRVRVVAQIGAVIVALLGLLTLGEHLFGWHLGIDELLDRELPGALAPFGPNRMVPATALCFLLIGSALLLTQLRSAAANLPAIAALALAYTTAMGYLYGSASFEGIAVYVQMAASTGIAFLLLGLGTLALRPDRGLVGFLTGGTADGKLALRLLLAILAFLPMLGGVLLRGYQEGQYSVEFGAALFVTVGGLIVGGLVLWNSRAFVRLEEARQLATHQTAELAAIVEFSADAIIGKDRDGRITSWNNGATRLFGYTRDEMVGQLVDRLIPADRSDEEARIQELFEQGVPVTDYVTRRLARDGRALDVSITLSAIKNASGAVIGTSKIVRDVTSHKAVEGKVRRLTRLYAALSACNKAIVRCSDEKKLFPEICRAAVTFGGMKMAWIGLIDESSRQVTPVASQGEGAEYLRDIHVSIDANDPFGLSPTGIAIREDRPVWCQDFQHDPCTEPWHDSSVKYGWGSSAALPLRCNDAVIGAFTLYSGEPQAFDDDIRNLLGEMTADIRFALENFAHEKKRQQAEADLHLQSAALSATINSVVITDPQGNIEWVNPAFTRITGYQAAEVIGQNPRLLKSGQQSDAYYANLWQTITSGRSWSGEFINVRKDGGLYTEEVTITPVRDQTRAIAHFVAVKQDVTEKKSLERQLFQTQRLEGIGLLASGIAHDLNNVLAPIALSIELLRLQFPGSGKRLDLIEESCRRGSDIIRQVLTFARGVEGERGALQVGRLVKEMSRLITETFPRNIEVVYHLAAGDDQVRGDPTQIHQVLLNLAVNARDAMPNGGHLTLLVERKILDEFAASQIPGARPGEFVMLVVRDTGTGIPPENLPHIFEPFFTTKPRGQGTGLGLSTVHGIVRSHQGFVHVRSELGVGTEFQVYLPALPPTELTEARARTATPFPVGHGELVLVADDEATIREITRLVLEEHGFAPLLAENGKEALELFHAHRERIKLVILDRMMPGMSGEEVARKIHQLAPQLPIFLSTGLLMEGNEPAKEEALKAVGVTAILHKPYTEAVLLKALRQHLRV
ncbi:MAG: PAS domain S-box protein [Opitutae bacterium]|nr:PAS domain S-box protein [Opitutae bacterium]